MDISQTGQQPDSQAAPDDSARLNALGESLAKKRSEAIAARESSGIEQQWLEDEEFYQGIDDANRSEHAGAWRTKPPGQYVPDPKSNTRSTVFVNITRPYCDAGAARFADMVLPSDDRNWSLRPTTLPDLVSVAGGKFPVQMQRAAASQFPNNEQAQQDELQKAAQQAQQVVDEAKRKADKAQDRIDDWQIEGNYHADVRKVIEDAARIGSGVLKGPIPVKRKVVVYEQNAIVIKEDLKPASKRIDPWNLYPDGACGESIHNGSYIWERDYLTPRQLHQLKGTPGYLDAQIDECLKEGPQKAVSNPKAEPEQKNTEAEEGRFEIWYYHGFVGTEDMMAAGCECDDSAALIPAMVTMVNARVVRASLNPLDSGDFPYDVMPWQRKSGLPWGNGIARQGRTPQRIVNAGVRNMMDNGGLSAGAQTVVSDAISPADGKWEFTPRKFWKMAGDADIDDVRKAMAFFEIPSRQAELMQIVEFGLKMMEDATGLPMLLQGQQGSAPDTVGGMTMLNNNASAVLRRLARTFDDCVTEPHIRRYYTWLLQYGDDDEKGDFEIDARGSSALVERDLQSQQIPSLLKASENPVFGIDPKKAMAELLKALKFDIKNFQFDDDKWQQIVQNLAQKQDPRIEIAKMKLEDSQQDRQHESGEAELDRKLKLAIAVLAERAADASLSSEEQQTFALAKEKLAETVLKLKTQKELSAASMVVDLHKHKNPSPQVMVPPTEPAGRAQPGQAYQQ